MKTRWVAVLMMLCSYCCAQPDNPFGNNVYVFDSSMDDAELNKMLARIYKQQRFNAFGDQRYAILFMPGSYGSKENIDIRTGYYTQILGLGGTPEQTSIIGALRTQDWPPPNSAEPTEGLGSTQNYWRGAENFSLTPTLGSLSYPTLIAANEDVWAVGKGSYLRRMHIKGSLRIYELGQSSGGFIANSVVDDSILATEQLFGFIRNSVFYQWVGINFNSFFLGNIGAVAAGKWPDPAATVIPTTPLSREKPFLMYDQRQHQYVMVRPKLKQNSQGIDWSVSNDRIPQHQCYIAKPQQNVEELNAALKEFKCLILTPGIYQLEKPLQVVNPDTLIYGLGFPALIPKNGQEVMHIDDVDGVQVAGIIFTAGPLYSPVLLEVGSQQNRLRHRNNPLFLYDIYCRIGGSLQSGQSQRCIDINSNDVLVDNTWLWRAEYGLNVGWFVNRGCNGLVVNGDYTLIYNLLVDNFQLWQTWWKGNYGRVYSYNSLLPADVPNQQLWQNNDRDGYSSYKVDEGVSHHQAYGLNVYSFFRDSDNIFVDNAVESPSQGTIDFTHLQTFWLGGHYNTGIRNIINERGQGVDAVNRERSLQNWP